MMRSSVQFSSCAAFAVVLIASSPARAEPPKCITADCHSGYNEGKSVHPPAKNAECDSCHQPKKDRAHPSKKGRDFTPAAEGPELCHMCHDKKNGGKIVHEAIKMEGCLGCHSPHKSNHAFLLKEKPGKDLCGTCHESAQKTPAIPHKPYAEGKCAGCHNPHSAPFRKLLVEESPKLCVRCHAAAGEFAKKKTMHPPVAEGCGNCHKPHGGKASFLLDASSPSAFVVTRQNGDMATCLGCFYTEYAAEKFASCLECHDEKAFTERKTTTATAFRDRDRNLHSLHVNRRKGITCTVCHEVHAGDSPALLRKEMRFGSRRLPIAHTKAEKGGSCAPACHAKQVYER
ncbi:MAG: cytochrome c3 family protein [Deltaproteobacteria bacterium]|nr:cytochrome c3 family protein [Deltaproteobacteria bacterium]